VRRDERCERQVERDVGNDVADFVERSTESGLHPVLARRHAVHRVERHASEQPGREQQEDAGVVGRHEHGRADRDRAESRGEREMVRRHSGGDEAAHDRPQHVLECRLEIVDRWHRAALRGGR
jgi:hypothetical protein